MNRIGILFVVAMTFVSCTLFPDESLPEREEVRPPPLVEVPDTPNRYYYLPNIQDSIEPTTGGELTAPSCEVTELVHETDPETVEAKNIDFVADTVKISEELDPQPDAADADYLHLKDIDIVRVSGSSLEFVQWIRIWMDPDNKDKIEVAWGNNSGDPNNVDLRVDGSVNLRDYLTRGVLLRGEVRASAPSKDTKIKARLVFVKYFNCES